ncbi:hypothetical protein DOM22_05335 [Bdellovibrio sp. ZAP7]|uniref:hypothetical protein n=1 Tax=Bdellovibrio sp. ZAP7 TaxID=2231053 RepID=UPI00115C2ADA|nr:hypothetical protein [Bdellovibrio sp. ZAP7]QDK44624.1 hypothetical protein DOM22_05335 [Bdellovibrio sp. ZAP7]
MPFLPDTNNYFDLFHRDKTEITEEVMMEDHKDVEIAREALNLIDSRIEWVKTKKVYLVHINLNSWSEEMQLHLNLEFSDADVEAILRMNMRGRNPISFTAAYSHMRMRGFLHKEFLNIFEYCEVRNLYVDFKPGELEIRPGSLDLIAN